MVIFLLTLLSYVIPSSLYSLVSVSITVSSRGLGLNLGLEILVMFTSLTGIVSADDVPDQTRPDTISVGKLVDYRRKISITGKHPLDIVI